jgi:low affinity Fe/Cu permease
MTKAVTDWAGSPAAVLGSIAIVLIWAVLGPVFNFSDTWQLWINTGTTILTFNMVFIIQATQNRSDTATQIKLDELIKASKDARNRVIDLEDQEDEVVEKLRAEFARVKKG